MLKLDKCRSILNKNVYNLAIRTISTLQWNQNVNPLTGHNLKVLSAVLSKQQILQINLEYRAVLNLLKRSNVHIPPNYITERGLHTTSLLFSEPSKKPDEPSKKPEEQRKSDKSKDENDQDGNKKKNENEEKLTSVFTKAILWMMTIYMIIAVASLILPRKNYPETATRYVSWKEFVHEMLSKGEVKELIIRPDMEMVTIILHDGAVIKGRHVSSTIYHMAIADAAKFEQKVRNAEQKLNIKEGVLISYERSSDVLGRVLITLAVFAIILSLTGRLGLGKSPLSMDSFSQMTRAKFTLVDPFAGGKGVLFKDVAGLQEAKIEVIEFVDYLKKPERYQQLGAKVPKGALLLGPPGCGKTLLAKAVATEAQVPFLSMNGSEFIEMIGGLGAARVRDLFKEAKKRAPCIIYIDEIDAIGKQRAEGGGQQFSSGESEQTLNQLLVEMDGMASKEGVLMLASTNRADVLDKALLRPGRFDRHILIDLPNLTERQEIFEKHLSGVLLEHSPDKYSVRLARLTPGFSGADIANVCNEAALHAARGGQKMVTIKNLEYAVERLVGGTEKRSHALSLVERRVIAYHESGHALVGWLLEHSDVLLKVTIVPRTSLALGFAQYTPSEQKLYSKEDLHDKMCMALGGRVAESLTFNQITTGAQNDLEKVTRIAYAQIKQFGMSENIGLIYIPEDADKTYTGDKPYSKMFESLIDIEARRIVAEAYARTEKILRDNKEMLEKLAENLLKRETLNYDEVVELIGPPKFEDKKRKIDAVDFEDTIKNLARTKDVQ